MLKDKARKETDLSMFPLLLPGDRPIIKKTPAYRLNDIVVFLKKGRLISHRVVYISQEKKYLVTKGDNNLDSDGKISKSRILGKVEELVRGRHKVTLSHLYLTQSSIYTTELNKLAKGFYKSELPFILLKGLPIHLHLEGAPPQRLYLDADILVEKTSTKTAIKVLQALGYKARRLGLLGKSPKSPSQVSFVKKTFPFPVTIDLHFEPAIGFTKTTDFNLLLPNMESFNKYLFNQRQMVLIEKTRIPILKKDALLIYLLLHFFHHNFSGEHRLQLINSLIRTKEINWGDLGASIEKYNLKNFIYPALLVFNKYYKVSAPKKFLQRVRPSHMVRLVAEIICILSNPFSLKTREKEAAKKFIFLLLFSPVALGIKIQVLLTDDFKNYFFPAIKSLFINSKVNSSTSRVASSSESP